MALAPICSPFGPRPSAPHTGLEWAHLTHRLGHHRFGFTNSGQPSSECAPSFAECSPTSLTSLSPFAPADHPPLAIRLYRPGVLTPRVLASFSLAHLCLFCTGVGILLAGLLLCVYSPSSSQNGQTTQRGGHQEFVLLVLVGSKGIESPVCSATSSFVHSVCAIPSPLLAMPVWI